MCVLVFFTSLTAGGITCWPPADERHRRTWPSRSAKLKHGNEDYLLCGFIMCCKLFATRHGDEADTLGRSGRDPNRKSITRKRLRASQIPIVSCRFDRSLCVLCARAQCSLCTAARCALQQTCSLLVSPVRLARMKTLRCRVVNCFHERSGKG